MDRTKVFHFAAGLLLVAALVGVELVGSKLSPETKATALGVLGLMLWQVKGWFSGGPPAAPLACLLLVGCAAAKKDAAEVTYDGQLIACVDRAQTLAESKACRAAVDEKWGITRSDAGRD